LVEFWGYEWNPEEYAYPYELGGWYTFLENGLNKVLDFFSHPDRKIFAKAL